MKIGISVIIALLGTCVICSMALSDTIDCLRPQYSKESQELRRMIRFIAQNGFNYGISFTNISHRTSFFCRQEWVDHVYHIALPKDMQGLLGNCSDNIIRAEIPQYLQSRSSSFSAAIIMLAWLDNSDYGAVFSRRLYAIERHDPLEWDRDFDNNVGLFAGYFSDVPLKTQLFYESIPEKFRSNLFGQEGKHIRINGIFRVNPLNDGEELQFNQTLSRYLATKNTHELENIPYDVNHVEKWLATILLETKGDNLLLDGFLFWCKSRGKSSPCLSSAAMGLFIVLGYSFDSGSGQYNLMEQGRALLDYIVAFPISENTCKLHIVAKGGNQQFIMDLMRKSNTEDKWNGFENATVNANHINDTLVHEIGHRFYLLNFAQGGASGHVDGRFYFIKEHSGSDFCTMSYDRNRLDGIVEFCRMCLFDSQFLNNCLRRRKDE